MSRVVRVRRRLVLAFVTMAGVLTSLPGCNAFLDDFVFVADGAAGDQGAVDATSPGDAAEGPDVGSSDAADAEAEAADGSGDADAGPPVTYFSQVIADKPIAYWRLDEPSVTVFAASQVNPQLYRGEYQNSVTVGVPGALVGDPDTAAHFEGMQGVALFSGAFKLYGATPFTIEMWLRPTNVRYQTFFECANPDAGDDLQLAEGTDFFAGLYRGTTETDDVPPASHQPLLKTWNYVVLVGDGKLLTLYLNSTQAAVSSLLATDGMGGTVSVGGATNGDSEALADIDEVAIYDRALPQDTIDLHYQLAGPHPPPGADAGDGGDGGH